MNDRKTKDIFFGIVAIATLIVAIIGATLAYFTLTAGSNEGAINAQSAVVSIAYNDGQQVSAQADQLIPAEFESVVAPIYERDVKNPSESDNTKNYCLDKNGKQVCSVYRFTVTSDIERTITATLNNEFNGFESLAYAVYDVTSNKWISLQNGEPEGDDPDEDFHTMNITKCSNLNNVDPTIFEEDDCYQMDGGTKLYNSDKAVNSLFGIKRNEKLETVKKGVTFEGEHTFDLVIFLRETGEDQNIDQGKKYSGTIKIDVDIDSDNGKITGTVD